MKMILSAIVTLSAVAAFANSPVAGSTSSTATTTTTTGSAAAPAPAAGMAHTTTTTKEAKVKTTTMTKEQAEKACAKETNKDACMKKYMPEHTM